ncbi:MAG: prolipoprotein diacylglyceryl transferase [Thermodesulfobacteriota bacterium]
MFHLPRFDPVAFHLGPLPVSWYYLMYALGFLCAWGLGTLRALKPGSGWRPGQAALFILLAVPGLMIGARLGYVVFYNLRFYLAQPELIPHFWLGGMSFHGGFLGVLAAVVVFNLITHKKFYQTTDFIAPLAPLGLLAGRVGNFLNAELWGRPAQVPWAVVFPGRVAGGIPRHPSQLYEAFGEGLALFVVLWLFSRRPRPRGRVSGLFLLLYGGFRFLIEFFREPDRHLGFVAFGWMSLGQLLCLPLILWGFWLLVSPRREQNTQPAGTI